MPLVVESLRLLVFDLDGTLIDSQKDLVNSVNATLASLHLPLLEHSTVASYVGDGAAMLVRRALTEAMQSPPEEEFASHALDFFLQYYRIHKLDFTYVYDGVLDSLTAIRSARPDLPMAVLTNKPVRPSREICKALELSSFFFQIYGGDSFVTKKPDPEGLHTLLREASTQRGEPIAPQQCLMIGDSGIDVLTARNAGTQSLGCTFGLSPHTLLAENPDALSESPHDWRRLLLGPN